MNSGESEITTEDVGQMIIEESNIEIDDNFNDIKDPKDEKTIDTILTEVSGETGPVLAPQKMKLS